MQLCHVHRIIMLITPAASKKKERNRGSTLACRWLLDILLCYLNSLAIKPAGTLVKGSRIYYNCIAKWSIHLSICERRSFLAREVLCISLCERGDRFLLRNNIHIIKMPPTISLLHILFIATDIYYCVTYFAKYCGYTITHYK
jgi:hypothetical protein